VNVRRSQHVSKDCARNRAPPARTGVCKFSGAWRKVLCTEKPKARGVTGVNPHGLASDLFCGVSIIAGSRGGVSMYMLDFATGEPGNGDLEIFASGDATVDRASFIFDPARPCGRDRMLPNSLGKLRPTGEAGTY
jgi:hypothetical protein